MLDIRKRTGWIFFGAMLAQILLVSAQVQTKSGTRALQAVSFEAFSRVEYGTASVVHGLRNVWGNYFGLRGVRAENEALKQRLAALEVQLLNAAHMPNVPGAKTDQADAAWDRPAGRARAGAAQLRARRSGGCGT